MTCEVLVHPHSFDRIAEPAADAYPVDLGDLSRYLRKGIVEQDPETLFLLKMAISRAEGYLERAIIEQTWVAHLDGFWGGAELELPRPKLRAVTSIKYLADESNVETTVASTVYEVDTVARPGRVRLAPGQSWPTPYARRNAVRVTFTAGYGTSHASVPGSVQGGLVLLITHYDRNRAAVLSGTIATELPEGVKSMLDLERIPWAGD